MSGIGLWNIADGAPTRLKGGEVGLERHLEEWIERDPDLLERGLVVVARQLWLEGGPLDLLALDPQGRWVLIEIKREWLRREVIAQAIDYASCLEQLDAATLRQHCDAYLISKGSSTLDTLLKERGHTLDDDSEELELIVYLVGTGIDAGLERMVAYLGNKAQLPIRVVTFSVFKDANEQLLLAREIHEQGGLQSTASPQQRESKPALSTEKLLVMAETNGIGEIMRTLYAGATEAGLYPRRYSRSFMFTPPQNKTRCLIYAQAEGPRIKDGKLWLWIGAEPFEQFYGISQADFEAAVGASGEVLVDVAQARRIAEGLKDLFKQES